MNVSMSIVTYNSADEIEGVLDSLAKSNLGGIDLKVYVVDNNSTDNTTAIIKEKYPEVVLIENEKNLGFGAAHNVAINMADSEYHIIVNPDIVFLKNTLQDLASYVSENPDAVIVTPKILNNDEELSEQFLPKKNPKIKYLLGGIFENKSKICKRWRREYTMQDRKNNEPCEIDFCTGCFMFCRTEALKKVGGFDERYFLHFEDADLTREMKKIGKTMFVPFVQVVHKWHRDNHGNKKILLIAFRSMMIYFKKWNLRLVK
ncbi:glycosyltransferase family 2 protein [Candidatus Saccharibacteria bacterium]|nr:glycosyltransferase family 2 protein [Candidatus Saccharibacteria bacterium]